MDLLPVGESVAIGVAREVAEARDVPPAQFESRRREEVGDEYARRDGRAVHAIDRGGVRHPATDAQRLDGGGTELRADEEAVGRRGVGEVITINEVAVVLIDVAAGEAADGAVEVRREPFRRGEDGGVTVFTPDADGRQLFLAESRRGLEVRVVAH